MDLTSVLSAANPNAASSSKDKNQLGADYNQFLRLLTTQLQYQDPLSPLDTNEFTNQLVQFSNVEQSIKSNDYLQKLLTLQSMSLTGIGLNYVGLNVQIPGSRFQFDGTHAAPISYEMPATANSGTISVLDESGNVVYSQEPDLTAGSHNFMWNGKDYNGQTMPAGVYQVRIGAMDEQQKSLNVSTFVSNLVTGVQTEENGNVLLMINGGQLVPVTDVRQATL